jgi:hypothetical protein
LLRYVIGLPLANVNDQEQGHRTRRHAHGVVTTLPVLINLSRIQANRRAERAIHQVMNCQRVIHALGVHSIERFKLLFLGHFVSLFYASG